MLSSFLFEFDGALNLSIRVIFSWLPLDFFYAGKERLQHAQSAETAIHQYQKYICIMLYRRKHASPVWFSAQRISDSSTSYI